MHHLLPPCRWPALMWGKSMACLDHELYFANIDQRHSSRTTDFLSANRDMVRTTARAFLSACLLYLLRYLPYPIHPLPARVTLYCSVLYCTDTVQYTIRSIYVYMDSVVPCGSIGTRAHVHLAHSNSTLPAYPGTYLPR
jgi:hypothetical protein